MTPGRQRKKYKEREGGRERGREGGREGGRGGGGEGESLASGEGTLGGHTRNLVSSPMNRTFFILLSSRSYIPGLWKYSGVVEVYHLEVVRGTI